MPIFRYFAVAGSALLALLFVADACFNDEGHSHFGGSLSESATYLPRSEEIATMTELRFTRDASAAERVKEVFAQFIPNEGRHGKRHASVATVIR
jgi:hypothetical protein